MFEKRKKQARYKKNSNESAIAWGCFSIEELAAYKVSHQVTDEIIAQLRNIKFLDCTQVSKLINIERELAAREFYLLKEAGIIYAAVFNLCDWELACIVKETLCYRHFYQELLNNTDFMNSLDNVEKKALSFHKKIWDNFGSSEHSLI